DEKLNSKTLENIFKSGFEQYELGIIPPSLDQVLVSSTTRLRSHEIKALYIMGTNDGIFPSVLDEDGILSDLERESLRENGLEVAKDSKSRAFEEQFLMYVTLTTMSEYLRISYPISNEEGKTLRPSIVISRLRKIFPNLCEKSNIIKEEEDIEKVSSPKPTFNEFITQLQVGEDEIDLSDIWLSVYNWFMNNKEWKEKFINISQGFNHTNYAEIVDTRRVRKLYGSKLNMSVSRLEKFSQCPFAYFIRYGINAKERKIYKVSTPDIGTLMHDVIENFSRYIEGENISWEQIDENLCQSLVSAMIDEKIKDMKGSILNSSPRYKYMTNRIKDILSKSMEVISKQISRGDFEPSAYELAFGFNGDFPPISIELSSGERVNLIGRIDRVDKLENEDATFVRIIDYKSGKQDFSLSDIYYGLQIQLLVYLDALLQEIENTMKKQVNPAGMLYFNMDDPLIST
ncbi:helicase-exonuclease AddAB subunit AddB, partial [Coprococcus sp. MSK.21.13]|nr:helicase-exonuclease AddAB subunit AddB [Coprococcus sp. MSK.21.13]